MHISFQQNNRAGMITPSRDDLLAEKNPRVACAMWHSSFVRKCNAPVEQLYTWYHTDELEVRL